MTAVTATTIHLIRHATYDLLDRGILAGRTPGWSLNATGRAQAAALGQALAGRDLEAVIASPLERAQETAEAIAGPHGLALEIEPGLNEVDFGAWSGTPFATLHQQPGWQTFNVRRSVAAPPGGETMLAVQLRALEAVMTLVERFPDAEIVAVSHADVIKALLAHALGTPLDMFQRIEIAPASRSTLVIGSNFIRIMGVNLPPDPT